MLLLIDNYDSFVHNLARHFERLGQATRVMRNDAIDVERVRELRPAAIVLSPGPCAPQQAGASLEIVRALHTELPMLGVCLGHQVIAEAFGAQVVRAGKAIHGQASPIEHDGTGLFEEIPSPLAVGRYHSLVVDPVSLPAELQPNAWTTDGVLMAFAHMHRPVYGVQFHPEAILTQHGYEMLANFLRLAGQRTAQHPRRLAYNELGSPLDRHPPMPTGPITF